MILRANVFLRAAAVAALLQAAGHAFLLVSYVPTHGAQETAVVDAMKLHRFSFQGFMRSYWDLYFGYGLFAAANALIEGVLFWVLAAAATHAAAPMPIVVLFIVANAAYAVLCWKYFYYTPIVFDLTIAALLALALISDR